MKQYKIISILLAVVIQSAFIGKSYAQEQGYAKITFVTKENDKAITYLSSLKGNDISRLKYELKRYYLVPEYRPLTEKEKKDEQESLLKGYVERIVVGRRGLKIKDHNKQAQQDLFYNYKINDRESLNEVIEKIEDNAKAKAKTYANNDSGDFKKYLKIRKQGNKTQLSKYFTIRPEKRLRNGKTFKKPAGSIALLITYKVREGKNINTYVNIVEEYLKAGSHYELKYHGTETRRSYYLEFISSHDQAPI